MLAAIATATAGNWYMYHRYRPEFGIDDANITQVYASSLVQGHGFRYYAGGEFVEGSTSLLWTLINSLFFAFLERPEAWIALWCFVLCCATIYQTIRVVRASASILGTGLWFPGLSVALLFLATPIYFVWAVWPLMDVSLWTLLFIAYLHAALSVPQANRSGLPLIACSALLPLVRPEGVLFSLAASVTLIGIAAVEPSSRRLRPFVYSIVAAVAASAAVTAWRLIYFGFPLPNTVYAKVSTGWLAQLRSGAVYTWRFLHEPAAIWGALALVSIAGWIIVSRQSWREAIGQRGVTAIMPACFVLLSAFIYSAAGGDHFAHYRFFHPLLPIFTASLALVIGSAIQRAHGKAAKATLCLCLIGLGATAARSVVRFVGDRNDWFDKEFRLAEEGRAIGATLSGLDTNLSLGVLTAGGIARTYPGPIRDLLGLNWVEMAHAVSDKTGKWKNHGAFSKDVFFKAMPDIVGPRIGPCSAKTLDDSFDNWALGNLYFDARFREAYRAACYQGVVFYSKALATTLEGHLTLPGPSAGSTSK